jgi:hypothetical protein
MTSLSAPMPLTTKFSSGAGGKDDEPRIAAMAARSGATAAQISMYDELALNMPPEFITLLL